MKSPLLLATLIALVSPAVLQAQTTPETAGVMVVRYFKCDLRTIPELREFLRAAYRPHLDRVVAEGGLTSYGELAHSWGDEWNVVDYFTAPDLQSAFAGITEAHAYAMEQTPDLLDRHAEFCSEHKDNIYTIRHLSPTSTGSPPPGQAQN